MSSVHCPKDKASIPMGNCLKCEFVRKQEDVSSIWCRYLIGKSQEQEKNDYRRLYAQVNYKRKRADRLYKTGKPRIAEQIEYEIMTLRKEIKQHEVKNETFDQKKKTVL